MKSEIRVAEDTCRIITEETTYTTTDEIVKDIKHLAEDKLIELAKIYSRCQIHFRGIIFQNLDLKELVKSLSFECYHISFASCRIENLLVNEADIACTFNTTTVTRCEIIKNTTLYLYNTWLSIYSNILFTGVLNDYDLKVIQINDLIQSSTRKCTASHIEVYTSNSCINVLSIEDKIFQQVDNKFIGRLEASVVTPDKDAVTPYNHNGQILSEPPATGPYLKLTETSLIIYVKELRDSEELYQFFTLLLKLKNVLKLLLYLHYDHHHFIKPTFYLSLTDVTNLVKWMQACQSIDSLNFNFLFLMEHRFKISICIENSQFSTWEGTTVYNWLQRIFKIEVGLFSDMNVTFINCTVSHLSLPTDSKYFSIDFIKSSVEELYAIDKCKIVCTESELTLITPNIFYGQCEEDTKRLTNYRIVSKYLFVPSDNHEHIEIDTHTKSESSQVICLNSIVNVINPLAGVYRFGKRYMKNEYKEIPCNDSSFECLVPYSYHHLDNIGEIYRTYANRRDIIL